MVPQAFELVSEAMNRTCRPQRAGGSRLGVMYTPALQSDSEARDEAVAASRLLLSRQSTSMLEARKQALTCYDEIPAP